MPQRTEAMKRLILRLAFPAAVIITTPLFNTASKAADFPPPKSRWEVLKQTVSPDIPRPLPIRKNYKSLTAPKVELFEDIPVYSKASLPKTMPSPFKNTISAVFNTRQQALNNLGWWEKALIASGINPKHVFYKLDGERSCWTLSFDIEQEKKILSSFVSKEELPSPAQAYRYAKTAGEGINKAGLRFIAAAIIRSGEKYRYAAYYLAERDNPRDIYIFNYQEDEIAAIMDIAESEKAGIWFSGPLSAAYAADEQLFHRYRLTASSPAQTSFGEKMRDKLEELISIIETTRAQVLSASSYAEINMPAKSSPAMREDRISLTIGIFARETSLPKILQTANESGFFAIKTE